MKNKIEFEECSTCEFRNDDVIACVCSKLSLAFHNLLMELHLIDEDKKYCNWYLRIIGDKE